MSDQFRVLAAGEIGKNREVACSLRNGDIHMAERTITETDQGIRHGYIKNGFVFAPSYLPSMLKLIRLTMEKLGISETQSEAPQDESDLPSELPAQSA